MNNPGILAQSLVTLERRWAPLRALFQRFDMVHRLIGLLGNLVFLTGSILFLREATQQLGTWFFIIGAASMLVGSFGSMLVAWERQIRERRRQADGFDPVWD